MSGPDFDYNDGVIGKDARRASMYKPPHDMPADQPVSPATDEARERDTFEEAYHRITGIPASQADATCVTDGMQIWNAATVEAKREAAEEWTDKIGQFVRLTDHLRNHLTEADGLLRGASTRVYSGTVWWDNYRAYIKKRTGKR